jgi:outer membrane autotransporter protein
VTVDGVIAPGGPVGSVLTVGSVDFHSGSALAIDATAPAPPCALSPPAVCPLTADRLVASGGAATIDGAALRLTLGSLDRDKTYQALILDAASIGGPAGTPMDPIFAIDQSFAFFDVSTAYDDPGAPEQVLLRLVGNGKELPEFATTRNQEEVGAALEEALLEPSHSSDLDSVFAALGGLTAAQVPEALDQMTGEQLTEFPTTRLAIADRFQQSLQQRIRGLAWGDGEALFAERGGSVPVLAANPLVQRWLPGLAQPGAWSGLPGAQSMSSVLDATSSFQPAQGELGLGGWLDGYGLFGSLSGDSDSADLDYTIGGFSLGVDYLVAQSWLLGAAGGYAYSDLDFDGLSGSQHANTGQGALYLGYVKPWLQLGASGRFGYSAMESRREIDFMGRDADADFDGWDAGARVDAALDLWKLGPVELQPMASFAYTHLQQDEIDESGADSLELRTDEQDIDSAVSGLGARLHGVVRIYEREEIYFHPELSASWLHEFGDRVRQLDARIGGSPGAVYTVRGAKPAADAGVFGIHWSVVVSQRLHAFADYDVTLSSNLLQHGAAAGFKIVW